MLGDHPRSRGEYSDPLGVLFTHTGSSPLSRGIHDAINLAANHIRIIPALAGNTAIVTRTTSTSSDHPRSRGEYYGNSPCCVHNQGSSPLSRGIRGHLPGGCGQGGIIPALAGNTPLALAHLSHARDHPRSRGEYWGIISTRLLRLGSSPLSRGILLSKCKNRARGRIIPALAGNTWLITNIIGPQSDHPRSRGEYEGR